MCAVCVFNPNSHLYGYEKGLNDLKLGFSHKSPSCEYREINDEFDVILTVHRR